MTTQQRIAIQPVPDIRTCGVDFFRWYSAFKHGGMDAVEHYASILAGLILDAWSSNNGTASWDDSMAITSPPFAAIPSASHYLAESVTRKLRLAPFVKFLSYAPLRKEAAGTWSDYANLAAAQRAASQAEQVSLFLAPPAELHRPHIVVINDLRVTGQQERILSEYLVDRLGPKQITWLYLGEVGPQLASDHADVENRLNNAHLPTADSYVRFLCQNRWNPTARGVRRLLCLPVSRGREVFRAMPREQVARLASLAQAEQLCPAQDIIALAEPESSPV